MQSPLIKNQHKNKIRKDIRQRMKFIRTNLTQKEQYELSQKITYYIINDNRIKSAKNIGLFMSINGEIKTHTLIEMLLLAGKKIYIPILNPYTNSKILLFAQYTLSTYLILNKFNIYEPILNKTSLITTKELDILFLPLVSFDKNGNRLGMGGGFYDSTIKNWTNNNRKFLIGLAYDCQEYKEELPIENWDVPLSEIITPSTHWIWKDKTIIKKIKYNKY